MVSDTSRIVRLSLAIFVAVCSLSSAFAGAGVTCQSCSEDRLQSPEQCNMSSVEKDCSDSECFALTAELTNGTRVGMRGCFNASAGNCTTSACNQGNETLSGPEYFARCLAKCCTGLKCNTDLFPMLTEPSSTAVSTTTPVVTSAGPTSLGIKTRAFLYVPVFLLVTLDIMN